MSISAFLDHNGASGLPRRVNPASRPARLEGRNETLTDDSYEAGMRVRREVLGDEHVDRAQAGITDFTRDFQDYITRSAWGSVWTRPGLDRRTRSVITLTALIAHGHWSEFEMHVAAARRNGLTAAEIGEVILQTAVYCGVPAANHAFAIARTVLEAEPASAPAADRQQEAQ